MRTSAMYFVTTFALACAAPRPAPEPEERRATEVATAWPDRFASEQILTAVEVRIEGPVGLMAHVHVAQQGENHDYTVRTTAEGLVVEATLRPDGPGEPIRARLDWLSIAADRRIVVVERVSGVELRVSASGDVYHCEPSTSTETRAPTLVLTARGAR